MAGFSLHAGVAAKDHERKKLEQLCRYISRSAVSEKRLSITSHGDTRYQLKTPYRDGTTHVTCQSQVGWFNRSFSLSANGNTLTVGARNEASTTIGINGENSNDDAAEAGAVYVY